MATGGATTPGTALDESQYTLAELRAVVEVAHQAGTLVTAHAHGGGIADAVAAGADGIEHGFFLTGDTPRRAEPDWATVAALAERGVFVAATSLAAESCGVGGRKGRIAAGYDADVLVVAGDVRRDLTSILDMRAVYRAGALTSGVLDRSTQTAGR